MMKNKKNIVYYIYMYLIVAAIPLKPLYAQSLTISDKIWNGIGGKDKWDSTNYMMFTVTGKSKSSSISTDRKFLLNKKTGDVRFEGIVDNKNIVALFNVRSENLIAVFNENGAKLPVEEFSIELTELIQQYNQDLKILSLPVTLLQNSTLSDQTESKIINAERLKKVAFSNFLGKSGDIYISEDTGLIKRLDIDNKSYIITGHKDIGNGLILPTSFKNNLDSISFQKVASFTDLEQQKFKSF